MSEKSPFETWWDVDGYHYHREMCRALFVIQASGELAKSVAWRAWIASKEHSAEVTVNQLTEDAA